MVIQETAAELEEIPLEHIGPMSEVGIKATSRITECLFALQSILSVDQEDQRIGVRQVAIRDQHEGIIYPLSRADIITQREENLPSGSAVYYEIPIDTAISMTAFYNYLSTRDNVIEKNGILDALSLDKKGSITQGRTLKHLTLLAIICNGQDVQIPDAIEQLSEPRIGDTQVSRQYVTRIADVLEENELIDNRHHKYNITEKGRELLVLLNELNDIFPQSGESIATQTPEISAAKVLMDLKEAVKGYHTVIGQAVEDDVA